MTLWIVLSVIATAYVLVAGYLLVVNHALHSRAERLSRARTADWNVTKRTEAERGHQAQEALAGPDETAEHADQYLRHRAS